MVHHSQKTPEKQNDKENAAILLEDEALGSRFLTGESRREDQSGVHGVVFRQRCTVQSQGIPDFQQKGERKPEQGKQSDVSG